MLIIISVLAAACCPKNMVGQAQYKSGTATINTGSGSHTFSAVVTGYKSTKYEPKLQPMKTYSRANDNIGDHTAGYQPVSRIYSPKTGPRKFVPAQNDPMYRDSEYLSNNLIKTKPLVISQGVLDRRDKEIKRRENGTN